MRKIVSYNAKLDVIDTVNAIHVANIRFFRFPPNNFGENYVKGLLFVIGETKIPVYKAYAGIF